MNPLDELKLVQDIITTQEELCFKIISWAIGLITALTIGFFHKSVDINSLIYIISGCIIILGCFLVARNHWVTFYRAVSRSRKIEEEIKNNTYTRVKINKALRTEDDLDFFIYYRFYGPYLMLVILVIVSGLGKSCL